uniref:Wzt carbohydrate-binding domain-containing protein n=1 Tax=Acetatifactor sp. TaxID=1872090 RepID=UPI004056A827
KTIILVSHGMNEVEQFCDRVLLLNKSQMLMCGDGREAVQRYYMLEQEFNNSQMENQTEISASDASEDDFENHEFKEWKKAENTIFNCNVDDCSEVNSGKVKFLNVGMFDNAGRATSVFHQGEDAFFLYEVEILQDINVPLMGVVFYDQKNTIIFGKDNLQTYMEVPEYVKKGNVIRCLFKIKMDIAVGEYTFDVGINTMHIQDYDARSYRNQEEINNQIERLCCLSKVGHFAIHERLIGEPMKLMFHGCCDLPSETELIVGR